MNNAAVESIEFVRSFDPEIAGLMDEELRRQRRNIELIASENITSQAVLAAMGSVLTNKYAEGLPGKRYYGGWEHGDMLEEVDMDRAKGLIGAGCANGQPPSGGRHWVLQIKISSGLWLEKMWYFAATYFSMVP